MNLNMLALAVPLFLLLMLLEYIAAKKKRKKYFHLHNSIANISVGIAERLMDVFVTGLFFYVYDTLQKKFGWLDIKPGLLMWILLFLCTDIIWYWYHRFAHEINLFWAVHVVHHQSEDFNYTVSARITVFQAFVRTGFWCVLPLIGFPAEMVTSILLVHGLYPFFIHTRMIGKLGFLEYILVTPSHHRVHHANNEKYLDKNYGDVLIIWDKLFGTFQKEEEEPRYGLTKPFTSYSFLWQYLHYPVELFLAASKVYGLKNKMRILFGKPVELDPAIRTQAEKIFLISKKDIPAEQQLNKYVIWQVVLSLTSLFIFILFEHYISNTQQGIIAILILLTLINCGAIMEQRRWIFYLEFSRTMLAGISLVLAYPNLWLTILLLILFSLTLYFFETLKAYYLFTVYPGQYELRGREARRR